MQLLQCCKGFLYLIHRDAVPVKSDCVQTAISTRHSVTIKRVGHGWVRAYHFETRTIKVFLSLWDKQAIMPPMRIAVCFDGRIFIHDHIPFPVFQIPYVLFLCLFYSPSVNPFISISSLYIIHFLTAQTRSLCFTPTTTPCDTHSFHVYLRFPVPPLSFPTIPSTALRSEYPLNPRNVISNNIYFLAVLHELLVPNIPRWCSSKIRLHPNRAAHSTGVVHVGFLKRIF